MKINNRLTQSAFLLVIVGILSVGALAQLGNQSGRIKQPLAASISLDKAQQVEIRDAAGQVVLSGTFEQHTAKLTGSSAAQGLAEIEIEPSGKFIKHEIEATVTGLAASTEFKLVVDGTEVATFMTDKTGKRAMKYSRKDPSK